MTGSLWRTGSGDKNQDWPGREIADGLKACLRACGACGHGLLAGSDITCFLHTSVAKMVFCSLPWPILHALHAGNEPEDSESCMEILGLVLVVLLQTFNGAADLEIGVDCRGALQWDVCFAEMP